MATSLEPRQNDDAQEVAEVETLRRRVEPAVDPEGAGGGGGAEAVASGGFQQPPLLEDFDYVQPARLQGGSRRRGRAVGSAGGMDSVVKKRGSFVGGLKEWWDEAEGEALGAVVLAVEEGP